VTPLELIKELRETYPKTIAFTEIPHSGYLASDVIETLLKEIEILKANDERYKFLTDRDSIFSCFNLCYNTWDGSDGKVGFDSVVDQLMKENYANQRTD
jgi:hypothetical protein